MSRIIMLVTMAGRRLAEDGVPFFDSRHARRVLMLSATLTAAVVVGLLWYATPSRADLACDQTDAYCMEKTASAETVKVDEPMTFTIIGSCLLGDDCRGFFILGVTDTLPAGLEFFSASTNTSATCSESAGTVTCAPLSFSQATPFVETITVIPRQCGTFTNTATSERFDSSLDLPVSETFTVECPPPLPATKEQCKNGGWREFGYPNQGTCVSDVNRRNR
jgi:hypothetical protein